jgi:hypothetical protein
MAGAGAITNKYLAIGLLLFAFLLLASLAVQQIQSQSQSQDGFISSGGSEAVTRAADCSCIPGYIPSKRDTSYVCQKLGDPSITRQCY